MVGGKGGEEGIEGVEGGGGAAAEHEGGGGPHEGRSEGGAGSKRRVERPEGGAHDEAEDLHRPALGLLRSDWAILVGLVAAGGAVVAAVWHRARRRRS